MRGRVFQKGVIDRRNLPQGMLIFWEARRPPSQNNMPSLWGEQLLKIIDKTPLRSYETRIKNPYSTFNR